MKLSRTYLILFLVMQPAWFVSGCSEEQNIETHMRNAQLYHKDGKYKAAIIELKNVLQRDANNKDARLLLGNIYLKVEEGASAEKELVRAADLGVPKESVSLKIAKAKILQGKFDEALENISLEENPSQEKKIQAELLRGDAYFGLGNVKNALASYENAASIDEKNSAALIGLAKVSLRQREYKNAEKQLSSISESDDNAVDMLLIKAEIAKQRLRYEDVEQYFAKAMELSQQRNQRNKALNIQGQLVVVQLMNNKVESALENVNQILKAAPQSVYAKYLRGLVAYQQKDYDTVFPNLLEVLAKVPEHLPSSLLLGASSYATGNYQQANAYLTTFVNKVPTHIHARKLLGVVRLRLNKPDEAVEVLKSASSAEQEKDAELLAIIGQAVSATGDRKMGINYLKRAKKVQPESSSIRAELAKVYMRQGAYDKAVTELEGISGEGKNKAKVMLVYTHLRNENFTSARKEASELLASEPDNPAWQVVAGGVEMIAGDRHKARKYFTTAINMKDDFAIARLNLARMEFEDGDLKGASEQFDKILVKDARNISALLGMAQVAERYGDIEQSVSWLEKAREADDKALLPRLVLARYYLKTGKYNNSLIVAKEMAAAKGDNVEVLRLIAASMIKLNRSGEALETYKKVIANDPDNAQWHFEIANIHRQMKNNNLATAELKKALSLNKNFLPAKAALIELDIVANNLDSATQGASNLKREHPKSSAGYLLLGDIYAKQKNLKKAQQAYIEGYGVNPSLVLVNKIFLLSNALKNYEQSIKITQDWLKKRPGDPVAGMYLGLSYQALGKYRESEQEYLKVLDKQPNNIMALNNLAFLLVEKDSVKALEYAQKAKKLAPENFAILDTYGWVLTKSGNSKEGLEILQQAVDKSNGNLSVRFHYAFALSENNRKSEAINTLSEITQAGQDFPEQADARNLLNKLK